MFRYGAKTAVLLAVLGGVMVGVGSLFGRGGAIIGLILGLAVVGFSYWKSDTLAIRAARAIPADEVGPRASSLIFEADRVCAEMVARLRGCNV